MCFCEKENVDASGSHDVNETVKLAWFKQSCHVPGGKFYSSKFILGGGSGIVGVGFGGLCVCVVPVRGTLHHGYVLWGRRSRFSTQSATVERGRFASGRAEESSHEFPAGGHRADTLLWCGCGGERGEARVGKRCASILQLPAQ